MSWNIKPQPLRWPITTEAGEKLTEVALKPIRIGAFRELTEKKLSDAKMFYALLALATGLGEDDARRLSRPDANSLDRIIADMVSKDADHFREDVGEKSYERHALLMPITGDNGAEISEITFKVPTVGTTDIMETYESADERTRFITMDCTGLSLREMEKLSVPDWNTIQGVLTDFLHESGDFFPHETSTQ